MIPVKTFSSRSGSENDPAPEPGTLVEGKPAPPRKRISMALVNFWLDARLLATFTVVGCVSALLQIVFPAPTVADGWQLWGLSFNQWRDIQFFSICFLALLVLVHVMSARPEATKIATIPKQKKTAQWAGRSAPPSPRNCSDYFSERIGMVARGGDR